MSSILPRTRRRQRQFGLAHLLSLALVLGLGYVVLREARALFQEPDAVLVLGGSTAREQFAAEFAREHPDLPVWISSGSNPEYAEWVFEEAGIERDRLRLDYRAVDTLTNFTTLVDEFESQGINSVYVITSDYHMRRAWVIGKIVLGSRGIEFKPVKVPSTQPAETTDKVVRDAARAVLWVATGHTGATLGRYFRD
ncbi:MAG: YdcF family protein [Elainellaceae cyanobacterium]